jgi:RNA polymerase sigma factor for flagellar operon FliA
VTPLFDDAPIKWHAAALAAVMERGDDWNLWRRFVRTRNATDRDALITRYGGQAKAVAARLYSARVDQGLEFGDYHHFAMVGLIECIDRFDPERGIRFESFATPRMRGAVLDGVESLSERQRQVVARQRIVKERTARLSEQAHASASSDAFEKLAEVAMGLALGFMLDDCAMYVDESRDSTADNVYDDADASRRREVLMAAFEALGQREQRILKMHYFHGTAFIDIARQLELTKGRISQLHHEALRTLRQTLQARHVGAPQYL